MAPTRYISGAFISPSAFEQARGEALWEREAAGSGSLGVVFSESAAGFGGLRWAQSAPGSSRGCAFVRACAYIWL